MTANSNRGSFDSLSAFVSTAKAVVATGEDLDEANTKAKIITPLVRTLGWPVHDNSEVRLEYSGEEDINKKPDYALFGPDGLYAVIEAKQIGRSLSPEEPQLRRYMRLYNADWGLLTNGDQYRIFQADTDGGATKVESLSLPNLTSSSHLEKLTRDHAYGEPSDPEQSTADLRISEEDKRRIIKLSVKPDIYELLVESIAPSVYGYEQQKLAVTLALFGGVRKRLPDGKTIRGVPHILFVGDPGTFLTDIVEYAMMVAPRGLYLSDGENPGRLLQSAKYPEAPAPEDVSEQSITTVAEAIHAGILQLEDLSDEDIKRLNQAFTATESQTDSDSQETITGETGVIAMSEPKYGRFDQYEPIGEQIDLEPALISRFDLIFPVTDRPDEEEDRRLAEHILNASYAGELNTQQMQMTSPDIDPEELAAVTGEVDPTIDPDLLRKYIVYAKQNCHPRMTEEAQAAIQEFYTDLRSEGTDEDAPVPVTARKLEATVRLAEASARVRLSDEVTREDAERVIEIVRSCLKDVGVDPESGDFDAAVVEDETNEANDVPRELTDEIKALVGEVQEEYDRGAPLQEVIDQAEELGRSESEVEQGIRDLKLRGEIYEPETDRLRTT